MDIIGRIGRVKNILGIRSEFINLKCKIVGKNLADVNFVDIVFLEGIYKNSGSYRSKIEYIELTNNLIMETE